jgi:phytoene dehydrogenase-like protein
MTMSSADYLDEWFEFDALKATKSASGIIGTFLGPRSPGSAYVLLHHYMGEIDGAFRAWGFQKGGTGAISESIASAAKALGTEIRTGADVVAVTTKDGKATGVALKNGEEIGAKLVISGLDPRLTFTRLVDPKTLPGDLVEGIRRYKFRGSSGESEPRAVGIAELHLHAGEGPAPCAARSRSARASNISSAPTTMRSTASFSRHPYMDCIFPSMIDPGMAPPGQHVMSIFVQYAPYELNGGWNDEKREAFGDAVVKTLARYAPNLPSLILHRQVITPHDIERVTGTHGGEHLPRRARAPAALLPAPGAAVGEVPHADRGVLAVRSRYAPRRRDHGRVGPARSARDPGSVEVKAPPDTIVIGGGANGLVAAAKIGKRALLLEAADTVGGQGRTIEFAPGFHAAPLSLDPGWLPPSVARGVGIKLAPVEVDTPLSVATGSKKFLTLSRDPQKAAEAIAPHSREDAAKWPAFTSRLHALAGFLGELYQTPAPDVDMGTFGDALAALSLGRKFRALGRTDMIELLRTLPLSAWELLDDWFDYPPLKAGVAAGGVQDLRQGPRSGGTGFVLLHHLIGAPEGSVRHRVPWKEGPDAFTRAAEAVARKRGVEIRTGRSRRRDPRQGRCGRRRRARKRRGDPREARPLHRRPEADVPPVDQPGVARSGVRAVRSEHPASRLHGVRALRPREAPRDRRASPRCTRWPAPSRSPRTSSGLERAAGCREVRHGLRAAARGAARPDDPVARDGAHRTAHPDRARAVRAVRAEGRRLGHGPHARARRERHRGDRGRRPPASPRASSTARRSPPPISRRASASSRAPRRRASSRSTRSSSCAPSRDGAAMRRPFGGLYLGGAGTHPGPGVLGGSGWLAGKRLLSGR